MPENAMAQEDCLQPAVRGNSLRGFRVKVFQSQKVRNPFSFERVIEIYRTFRHYDDIRRVRSRAEISEAAERKKHILGYRSGIIDEKDGKGRGQGPVLEGVIQNNDPGRPKFLVKTFAAFFRVGQFFRMTQEITAFDAFGIDGYGDARKFRLYLQRLVTGKIRTAVGKDLLESFAFPFIAAGQDGHAFARCFRHSKQSSDSQFRMGGFACASYCNISYTDSRDVCLYGFFQALVVEEVPEFKGKIIRGE